MSYELSVMSYQLKRVIDKIVGEIKRIAINELRPITNKIMSRVEYTDFYNDGFGFICKHCERELKEKEDSANNNKQARFMREGEAESKQPKLSNTALAKWLDVAQTTLICPNCGITEKID